MKLIISLSGGLDSATLLGVACSLKEQGYVERLLVATFKYGSRHEKYESKAAEALIEYYKSYIDEVKHLRIDYPLFNVSALVDWNKEIPKEEYNKDNIKSTSVPFRNGIMIAFLAALADARGYNQIGLGIHKAFNNEATYPDCTLDFVSKFSDGIKEGTFNKVEIFAPFATLEKDDIVEMGLSLNVPYHLTYSCYDGVYPACGLCATCRDRIEAFRHNKVIDPMKYAIDIDWEDCKPFEEVYSGEVVNIFE